MALALLCAVILYYGNVHRATTNGLWKSIDVRLWVEWSPERFTDGGNLLYFPGIGMLVRALPERIFGPIWQRMAYANALFGAGVLVLTYLIGLRLFRSQAGALVASLAHLAMGFFLLLATINEDVMPGYFWFVAAVACAVLPRTLSPAVLVLTAQCLALSWLFHSSLQLPGVGAFVVAIVAWAGTLRRAAWRVAVFCAALLPLPILSAVAFGLPWSIGLWSGKGIGTGWGGFSLNKVVFLWSGVAQSILGGKNLGRLADVLAYPNVLATVAASLLAAALFLVWLRVAWRERLSAEWRLAAALLTAVFMLGEAMNLYIQPQDPQMQIQPMTWFPFAVAAVYWMAEQQRRRLASGVCVSIMALTIALGVWNLRVYASGRHADAVAIANVETMRALAPPDRTVFLFHGFEGMATWLTVAWGRGTEAPEPGSAAAGRFNVIFVANQATVTPDRTADEAAREVVRVVDHALDAGFDVVAADIWSTPEDGWVDSFATISGPEKPRAIRAALHDRFTGTPMGEVRGWTRLYRITRRAALREAS